MVEFANISEFPTPEELFRRRNREEIISIANGGYPVIAVDHQTGDSLLLWKFKSPEDALNFAQYLTDTLSQSGLEGIHQYLPFTPDGEFVTEEAISGAKPRPE